MNVRKNGRKKERKETNGDIQRCPSNRIVIKIAPANFGVGVGGQNVFQDLCSTGKNLGSSNFSEEILNILNPPVFSTYKFTPNLLTIFLVQLADQI
jgi:hypothetical protein